MCLTSRKSNWKSNKGDLLRVATEAMKQPVKRWLRTEEIQMFWFGEDRWVASWLKIAIVGKIAEFLSGITTADLGVSQSLLEVRSKLSHRSANNPYIQHHRNMIQPQNDGECFSIAKLSKLYQTYGPSPVGSYPAEFEALITCLGGVALAANPRLRCRCHAIARIHRENQVDNSDIGTKSCV